MTALHLPLTRRPPLAIVVALAVAGWLVAWVINLPAAEWLTFELLRLERGSPLGEAVAFFVYDVPKVLLLLAAAITVVSFLRSFISPETVRRRLAGRGAVPGTVGAAGLGAVTPFCSCSSVPLFIGFLEAGVPLGLTFAFLVASPMVGPVPLILIAGLFGPLVAVAYLATGLTIAVAAGLIIGRLGLERHVEDYVWQIRAADGIYAPPLSLADRVRDAWDSTRSIVRRVLPFIVIGIGIGALIHGYVPAELVIAVGGRENSLAVPALVLLGVPLYLDAVGVLPIVEALIGKGLPLGSAMAFMMAVAALSLPEMVILRRVLKPRLLVLFVLIVSGGILTVGYLFNLLFA
ncbi:MAG TPA: permease [Gammaproteobacteria bacterium]|nr:permease [Gammaproteobacteria bacterium]